MKYQRKGEILSGYIVSNYNSMDGTYICPRLLEEAEKRGMRLETVGVFDVIVTPDAVYNRGKKLEKRDFVIHRFKTGEIRRALAGLGSVSYNHSTNLEQFNNKYRQLLHIKSDACRLPVSCISRLERDHGEIVALVGSPFVAKGLESSEGKEVFLIRGEGDYLELKSKFLPEKEWLFQEYIRSSHGRDVRIYSIRGEAVAAMERFSEHDFRANFVLNGTAKKLEITPPFRQIARDIYMSTGLDFVGIDLLYGESGYVFCEINITPGMLGIESVTGVNISEKILDMIEGDFY
ncbi:MAG: RimK family alpha-L-glutamate ligase [Bacillota bacterium]|nr:RimK family alpha-L-glutamate ligase [Bacillota bacterium]